MRYKDNTLFNAPTLKRNYRSLLPKATTFYSKEFPQIKMKSQWVKVHCCFHSDLNPSLSINLISGGFNCFACGTKGGDLLSFVMQRYQLTFKEACQQFGVYL